MSLFKSKKFWLSIAGALAVVLGHFFGVAEDTVMQIAGIVIALVLGQGLADIGKSAKLIDGQ